MAVLDDGGENVQHVAVPHLAVVLVLAVHILAVETGRGVEPTKFVM